jgi:peroxiredoxin
VKTIDQFSKTHNLNFFTIQDDGDVIASDFEVKAILTTVVIDKDGRITKSVEGFDGNEDSLKKAIDVALNEN